MKTIVIVLSFKMSRTCSTFVLIPLCVHVLHHGASISNAFTSPCSHSSYKLKIGNKELTHKSCHHVNLDLYSSAGGGLKLVHHPLFVKNVFKYFGMRRRAADRNNNEACYYFLWSFFLPSMLNKGGIIESLKEDLEKVSFGFFQSCSIQS